MRRLAPPAVLLAVLLAGCGSRPVAEYPPPPGPPRSPAPIQDLPGRLRDDIILGPPAAVLDPRRSTLTLDGRTVRTPLTPTDLAVTGGRVFVVGGRERVLAAFDRETLRERARVPAGAGPTQVVADDGLVFVADTTGQALLVFATEPELALVHRGALPGAPWALAVDERRDRIWVTIPGRNRLLAFRSETRPERLQGFATVRQPNEVRMFRGDVLVIGAGGARQLISPERD